MPYRVLVELFYPTDPQIVARLRNAERVPMRQRQMKQAVVGSIVNDIPAVSIPGLLQAGWIEEVTST